MSVSGRPPGKGTSTPVHLPAASRPRFCSRSPADDAETMVSARKRFGKDPGKNGRQPPGTTAGVRQARRDGGRPGGQLASSPSSAKRSKESKGRRLAARQATQVQPSAPSKRAGSRRAGRRRSECDAKSRSITDRTRRHWPPWRAIVPRCAHGGKSQIAEASRRTWPGRHPVAAGTLAVPCS